MGAEVVLFSQTGLIFPLLRNTGGWRLYLNQRDVDRHGSSELVM